MPYKKFRKRPKNQRSGSKKVQPFFVIAIGIFNEDLRHIPDFLLEILNTSAGAAIIIASNSYNALPEILLPFFIENNILYHKVGVNGAILEKNCVHIVPLQNAGWVKNGRICISDGQNINGALHGMDQLLRSIAVQSTKGAIGIIFSKNALDGAAGLKSIENSGGLAIFQQTDSSVQIESLLNSCPITAGGASFDGKCISGIVADYCLKLQRANAVNKMAQQKEHPAGKGQYLINTGKLEKINATLIEHDQALENALAKLAAANLELKIKESQLLELEQKQLYYKGAFDHAAIGMALIGPDGSWKEVNDSVCEIVGYSREELLKITFQQITHPEDLLQDLGFLSELIDGKRQSYEMEKRYFHKDGEIIWVLLVVSMVKDTDGKLLYFISQIEDITRYKKEEQQLKLFESVITNTNDSVMIIEVAIAGEQDPTIVYVNDAFTKMTGYSKAEAIGKTPWVLHGTKSDKRALVSLKKAIGKKVSCEIQTISYKKNNEAFWVNFSMVPMEVEHNGLQHFISISRDITQRKSQEAEKEIFINIIQFLIKLDFSEAWTRILESIGIYSGFQYAEAWMVNIDPSHMLLHKRWTNGEHIQKSIVLDKAVKIKRGEGLTGNAWIKNEVSYVNDITNQVDFLSQQFAVESKLNSVVFIPVLFRGQAIAVLSLYSAGTDIDPNLYKNLFDQISQQLGPYVQSKRAEDELARFFSLSPDLMAIAGTDGFFKKINPSFSKTLGYSPKELFEKPISHFTHPDDREITEVKRKGLGKGVPLLNFENRYVTKKGETRWLSWTSTPLAEEGIIFAVAKDVTEKKKLNEERKRILESISDFFFALDTDFNFTYINSATEKLFGIQQGAYIGENIWEKLPLLKTGIFFKSIEASIKSRKRVSFELFDEASGNWFEESCYPSDDGLSIFFRSINKRKAAEKALKEAFEEKDIILESIGDAFFTVDKNWIVTYWNKMAEKYLRVSRDNIVGKNLWEVFADAVSSLSYFEYHEAVKQNKTVHFEEFYEPLNIWLEVSAYPSHGSLSVYFKDISVRKKAEESIRTSNERYDMVAKATNDAIWDWDLVTNKVIRPGNRLETLYGYTGCESADVDEFWNSHAHPEDWEKVNKYRKALFENPAENFWEDEYRFLTVTGEYAYVHDKGYIIRNQEGKPIRMIGASKDITKEKEQVKGILRIQQNLDSLINTTTDLIWSINTDFKIIAANKAYSNAIQAISGEPVKEGDDLVLPGIGNTIKKRWYKLFDRALVGESFDIEESIDNPLVRSPWHTIVSFTPIISKDGKISGVACFAKDITELKKAGQKLSELNISLKKRAEELAYSNGELERFAYVASHDLQEPLRMVSSFLQLLERKYNDQLDDTARKYINFSVDGANRMKQLINDLLDYSRIGMGSVERESVNMNVLMENVLTVFKNEKHTIDAEIIVNNLPVIRAGQSAMFQLMQNLIGNALKYRSSEKPEIIVSGKEEGNEWIFSIQDNGIGIDQKFQEKIFIIFQRLHNKDEFGGTGIGLAICKKIIERHNGKIWVESAFGKGSKFIFVIPKNQK
ncbi:MAG: Phytochrome-like protein cph1 [Ferruginibacter sp.]|nr:Phytochrome-like protein cph1 [Ferruginibacter sp.]